MLFRNKNVNNILCDESILVFSITKEVDSINFKNAIILPFELPEFEKDIEEMIIEEKFGNDYYGDLVIENYPHLEKIVLKIFSLMNLNSLKICNCEKLRSIDIEYGEQCGEGGEVFYNSPLNNVNMVEIEST